jgi:hypothetical protein
MENQSIFLCLMYKSENCDFASKKLDHPYVKCAIEIQILLHSISNKHHRKKQVDILVLLIKAKIIRHVIMDNLRKINFYTLHVYTIKLKYLRLLPVFLTDFF